MEFREFGNIKNPKLLLIHGMATTWECFLPLIDELSKHYYLIIPALDGHNPNKPCDFECFDDEVERIENYLLSRYVPNLHGAFGFSMGGTILLKLLANNKIQIPKIILDAAYYLPLGVYSKVTSLVLTNILMELKNHHSLHPLIRQLLVYANIDVEALKKALYPEISSKSIYHCFLELFRYRFQTFPDSAHITYWYGSKEIFPEKSVKYLKQCMPKIKVKIFENLGHGELITKYPSIAAKEMRQIYA